MKNSNAAKLGIRYRPMLELLEERRVPAVVFSSDNGSFSGSGAQTVLTADLNNDGRPDVIVANQGTDFTKGAGTISVFFDRVPSSGNPNQFQPASVLTVSTSSPIEAIAVGDLNGDGRPDLVAAAGGSLYVFYNQTGYGGTTANFHLQPIGSGHFTALAIADMNKDGAPDIVAARDTGSSNQSELDVFQSTPGSTPTFTVDPFVDSYGPTVSSMAVADYNADGLPDVIVLDKWSDVTWVHFFKNTSTGANISLTDGGALSAYGNGVQVAAGDLNADGRPDLAVVDSTGVRVFINASTYSNITFTPPVGAAFDPGGTATSVVIGDVDGDGRPDLIVGLAGPGDEVSILLNATYFQDSTPKFQPFQYATTDAENIGGVAVADFNGDGRLDIATTGTEDGNLYALSNLSTNNFLTYPVTVIDSPGYGVQLFNRVTGGWVSLHTSDASILVVDPQGDIIGEFPKYGVMEYRPTTGWLPLSTSNGPLGDASQLSVDGYGDVFAVFKGHGVYMHRPTQATNVWTQLGTFDAPALAVDYYGDVVADDPGYGVQERGLSDTAWRRLANSDAYLLAMDAGGDIFADFKGYGLHEKRPYDSVFRRLLDRTQPATSQTPDATALKVDFTGANIVAEFPGVGLQEYQMATFGNLGHWTTVFFQASSLPVVDGYGNITLDLSGYGVHEGNIYSGTAYWRRLLGQEVPVLAVSGEYYH